MVHATVPENQRPLMRHMVLAGDILIAVTRKRIRHLHLRVHPPDGRVTISAPLSVRLHAVEAFAATRLEWIRRQQDRMRARTHAAPRRLEQGETHYLWGHPHELVVVEREGRQGVTLDDDRITLLTRPGSDVGRRAALMQAWHKSILHGVLPALIRDWETRLSVRLAAYHLRRMKTRWGTCNHRTGHIRLNTELVTQPANMLEYVLVHEMVHLIVPNHGPRFIALMNEHYPTWREARAQLRESRFTAV